MSIYLDFAFRPASILVTDVHALCTSSWESGIFVELFIIEFV